MRIKDLGEIGMVRRLAARTHNDKSVVVGIGDDAAVIKWTRDKYILFTCDILIEGVHFTLPKAPLFSIGWKALGRNISDIAAMGGIPRYALVSIGLEPGYPIGFLDEIYKGISELAGKFKINIVGGDMSKSQKLIIDVSLIGEVERGKVLLRSGARPGDFIFVTGKLGGSIKGKHLNFVPRISEARELVKNYKIHSMIDISDGLSLDLWRILDSSRVGARIYEKAIPVSREASSFESAIRDGEDFELLFTMPAASANKFIKKPLLKTGVSATFIGEILDKREGFVLVTKAGKKRKLRPEGYLHF